MCTTLPEQLKFDLTGKFQSLRRRLFVYDRAADKDHRCHSISGRPPKEGYRLKCRRKLRHATQPFQPNLLVTPVRRAILPEPASCSHAASGLKRLARTLPILDVELHRTE